MHVVGIITRYMYIYIYIHTELFTSQIVVIHPTHCRHFGVSSKTNGCSVWDVCIYGPIHTGFHVL